MDELCDAWQLDDVDELCHCHISMSHVSYEIRDVTYD